MDVELKVPYIFKVFSCLKVFWPDPPRGGSRAGQGAKIGYGEEPLLKKILYVCHGPFKELLLRYTKVIFKK